MMDDIHMAIDAGLAEECGCYTRCFDVDGLHFGWTYTGGKEGLTTLSDEKALAISRMIKYSGIGEGGFSWSKSIVYGVGYMAIYEGSHGPPIGSQLFLGELCDPAMIDRLQEWVVRSVGRELVKWVER